MAEAYRRINPDVQWNGIESKEDAVSIAPPPGRIDNVLIADVENVDLSLVTSMTGPVLAACMVLGDLLEHMKDPWTTLKRLVASVRPGGQVL